ncbi:helix-turn-helix domain-containing protein [Nonomuraea sp. NPDC052265]|uniref:helix-turn-helix domain-containing protein n=1 Tax=Nonomuraea sp. NPDC052265 TaxID=3364374 RepID=UPI0037C705C5
MSLPWKRNGGSVLSSGGSNRLLSIDELADYLGIPKATVYDRWKVWGIPAYKVGRTLRFRERNVETWLERNRAA